MDVLLKKPLILGPALRKKKYKHMGVCVCVKIGQRGRQSWNKLALDMMKDGVVIKQECRTVSH